MSIEIFPGVRMLLFSMRAFAFAVLTGLSAWPQSYQTSFSAVSYDRTKGPASWHGGVEVEAATGALNISLPVGPGIGARGAMFRPTVTGSIRTSWELAQGGIYQTMVNSHWLKVTDRPVAMPQTWGECAFGPGSLEWVWGQGTTKGVWAGPEGQSVVWRSFAGTGAAGDLMRSVDPLQVIKQFAGYESGWEVAEGGMRVGGFRMGPGGELVVGLVNPATAPLVTDVPSQVDGGGLGMELGALGNEPTLMAFPRVMLVIKGETAYEYQYRQMVYQRVSDRSMSPFPLGDVAATLEVSNSTYEMLVQPNVKAYRDYPDMYYDGLGRLLAWNARKAEYRLTRILNRHREWVEFSYPAEGGWVAAWKVGGETTGVSVSCSAERRLRYEGLESAQEYVVEGGGSLAPEMPDDAWWFRDAGGRMLSTGGMVVEWPTAEAEQRFLPDALRNVVTGETVSFSYQQAPGCVTGDGTAWTFKGYRPPHGTIFVPKVVSSVKLPGRAMAFEWTSYGYRRNALNENSRFAGYVQRNDVGYTDDGETWVSVPRYASFAGVTRVTETDDATGTQKVTVHDRKVPVPAWDMPTKWSSSLFYDAITRPDGSVQVIRFVPPLSNGKTGGPSDSTADEQMQTLAHLKHAVADVREYEPGANWRSELENPAGVGTAYGTTVSDRWDVRSEGNPAGELDVSGVPRPTRTRTWSRNLPMMQDEESLDWDASSQDWKLRRKTWRIPDLESSEWRSWAARGSGVPGRPAVAQGSCPAVREEVRVLSRNLEEWTFGRVDERRMSRWDATAGLASGAAGSLELPSERTTWDSGVPFSRASARRVGDGTLEVTTSFEYEASAGPQGVRVKSVAEGGTGLVMPAGPVGVAAYGYDSYGHLSSITPKLPEGRSWSLQQRQMGQGLPMQQTDANGLSTSFQWDAGGRLSEITPSNGEIGTHVDYDSDQLGMTVIRGARVTRWRFNGFGQPIREGRRSGDGIWSHRLTGYDLMGRKTWETGWRPQEGADTFWALPASSVEGVVAEYDYDGQGRLIRTTRATGEVAETRYALGGDGRLSQQVLAPGTSAESATLLRWDDLGRLIEIKDALGQLTAYRYDAADRISQVIQSDPVTGAAQARSWEYDALGRTTALIQPESGRTEYSGFSPQGKPTRAIFGAGSPGARGVTTTYDELGRVIRVLSDDGTVDQSFTFDEGGAGAFANGKLTTSRDGVMSRGFAYGELNGRLGTLTMTYASLSQPFSQSFTYDAYGDRVGGHHGQTNWSVDPDSARGLPWKLKVENQSIAIATYHGVTWNLTRLDLPGNIYSTFAYGADQVRLDRLTHFPPSGGALADWKHGYDLRGNLRTSTDAATGKVDTYGYDLLDRLVSAEVEVPAGWGSMAQSYGYDAFGNMISLSQTNAPAGIKPGFSFARSEPNLWAHNRLPENGTTGAHYDAQGNLDQVFTELANPGSSVGLTYDALGRAVALVDAKRGVSERYRYSAEGLRTLIEEWQGDTLARRHYNIYNDVRQLVSQFDETLSGGVIASGGSGLRSASASSALMKTAGIAVNYGPAGAAITSPAGAITVSVGQAVLFTGETEFGTKFTWAFGDNASATGFRVTHAFAAPGTYTVTLTCTATNYTASQASVTLTVIQPVPTISTFSGSATTVIAGEGVTLAWNVSNAGSVTLGGNAVAATGSQTVYPSTTTTYTLVATNAGGTVSSQVMVNVVQPPVISSFFANPSSIYQGDSSLLGWSVSGATSVSLDQGIGSVAGTGSRSVNPSGSTTYTLSAVNALNGVSVVRTALVTVAVNPRPTVPTIISFTTDAGRIGAGQGTTLRWNVTNAVGSVSVTLSAAGGVASSGAQWVTPGTTTTYALTATNSLDPSKSVSAQVTVAVVQKPVISFSAGATNVNVGYGTTLSWNIANGPESASIDQGVGAVAAAGTAAVYPGVTTTYTLMANNLGGTATATVTIGVTQKPIIVGLGASPATITRGRSAILSWQVQGSDGLTLNGMAVVGSSLVVAPSATTTYTLMATNGAGSASATATVTVQDTGSLAWKKDILYMGTREIAERDAQGLHITLTDHLGSPRFLVNGQGQVESEQKFLPFGESLTNPAAAAKFGKGFTNHEQTDPSGLIYMQARFYAPWYGRFLSPDPARDQHFEETQSWNIYSYVQNNPTMRIDPTGMVMGDPESFGMQVSQTMLGYLEGLATSLPFVGNGIAASLPQDVPEHQMIAREQIGKPVGEAVQLATGAAELKGAAMAVKGMQVAQVATTTGEVMTVVTGGAKVATQAATGGTLVASAMSGGRDSGGGRRGDQSQADPQRKGTPGNNQAQNKQFRDATRGLTKDESRRLHEQITKKNLGYKEIKKMAEDIISNRKRR